MHIQQVHCHRTARCTTIPRGDARQKFLLISAYLIGSAIIVLWLSYLPQLTGSLRDSFNIVPQYLRLHSVKHFTKLTGWPVVLTQALTRGGAGARQSSMALEQGIEQLNWRLSSFSDCEGPASNSARSCSLNRTLKSKGRHVARSGYPV